MQICFLDSTYVEEERFGYRLGIDLPKIRLTTILPRSKREHVEVFPFLFLVQLDPFQRFAVYGGLELQNVKECLVLALRVCFQPSEQLDSSTYAMGEIRSTWNGDNFAFVFVFSFPSFALARFRAVSHFPAASAGFRVDVNFRKTEPSCLLAFKFRRSLVKAPSTGILQSCFV